jgi:CDP-glycerol glycerophosphotransferase (TagB/SpsB family)
MQFPYNYTKAFKESDLLITDYSSVYFDFSYLHKPVIYTQFDYNYYYENHGVYDHGYFSEKEDGFGPVVSTYEETVNEIITCINNHFKLAPMYKKRVEEFYEYHDRNNSARVYNAIKALEGSS